MATVTFSHILFALIGGILPTLFWLWFWLREDKLHPEPRRLIILTFLGGMGIVIIALPLEQGIHYFFQKAGLLEVWGGFLLLFFWAMAEEISKYLAAKKIALSQKEYDEPVDALIYLITAALGFAAIENVIFLIQVSTNYGFMSGFITGNLRFVGATLIHVLSSAVIGSSIAFSFFHKEKYLRNFFWGLLFATLLHTIFNYFIINNESLNIFNILAPFWFLVIILLIVFEEIKQIKRKRININ